MRAENIEINYIKKSFEVELPDDRDSFIVVVSDGKAKKFALPAFGETVVVMHQGKVKRLRFEEGEEF